MNPHQIVLETIEKWLARGWLSQLDKAFVRFLAQLDNSASNEVLWAAALVSHQLARGEVFLDLQKLCQHPSLTLAIPDYASWPTEFISDSSLDVWIKALNQSELIGRNSDDSTENTPLVLDGHRLYLRRYWQYQQTLNTAIQQRLNPIRNQLPIDLSEQLNALFIENREQPDWQKIACLLALRARFAIITGGPGTGKTTTLIKLLALLVKISVDEHNAQHNLTILLAAPTGKAAARVSESINNALAKLDVPEAIKQQIPKKASTLHRLLGSRMDSRHYRHHLNNPLVADIVIVDEASMIDLEMMAALLDALPDNAQLILLGDKDQLASVEAGSVMGDLCQGAQLAAYDSGTRDWIKQYTHIDLPPATQTDNALNQQTVMLQHSHRFGEHSGIGQLAKAVNEGNPNLAQAILNDSETYHDLQRILLTDPFDNQLKQLVIANTPGSRQGYGYFLDVIQNNRPNETAQVNHWAKQVLQAFDKFQVLCALRLGVWGVDGLNQRIEQWLFPNQKPSLWYQGRPVMITRNDYNLGLMNGDIGITLFDSAGKLRVVFPADNDSHEAGIRWVSPMRLPDVVTAFAMTVHKSQGSEFNHVALVLPETSNPVLTRELIYTGITRAKENFTLLESQSDVFRLGVLGSCR
jgi:exodeoxyribonuclease V alpha subunit